MGNDSTELTFVRCPSCRSLVPAVSTRCRMCGATLDTSQKSQSGESDIRKSGRVRQRTMSQPDSDFSSAVDKVRDEEVPAGEEAAGEAAAESPVPAEEAETAAEVSPAAGATVDDPLSAYIEEVEVSEEHGSADIFGEEGESVSTEEEVLPEGKADEPPPAVPVAKPAPVGVEHGRKMDEPVARPRPEQHSVPEVIRDAEPKPRVVMESGGRKPFKPGGLSFGKHREERRDDRRQGGNREDRRQQRDHRNDQQRPDSPRQDRRSEQRGEQRNEQKHEQRQSGQRQEHRQDQKPAQRQEQSMDNRDNRRPFEDRDQKNRQPRVENEGPDRGGSDSARSRDRGGVPHSAGARREQPQEGKLFGWLVSYSSPSGIATELREGKFFVSRTSLKPTDLVIDDDSISMPHAIVAASSSEGLRVQDMLSEQGVFVRRKSADSWQRTSETTRVEHGDWLKFGEVEFLVCLIG